MNIRLLMMLLASLLVSIGCGSGEKSDIDRVVVRGKVTREGQPLPKGRITFFPTKGTTGPVSGAEIIDGEYTVSAKGGVPVGTHIVQFHEFQAASQAPDRGIPQAENNVLPPKFNEQSALEVAVSAEDAGEGVVRDFNLDKEFGNAAD